MEKVKVIELKIPNLGEAESTEIIEINISNGLEINENDPLIVLESEKAAMEIPSDFSGKIIETFVNEGDLVKEGQVFATMETANVQQSTSESKIPGSFELENNEVSAAPSTLSKNFNFNGVNAGPAVRKYARELEINLDKITGTGKNGRITKDDLKSYIHSKVLPDINFPDPKSFEKFGEFTIEKQTKIRALGSRNMSDSWARIPHVTHFEEVEMTAIDSFRAKKKISPLAFFVKISAKALSHFKIFNSSLLANNEILLKDFINIGIAVDTPDGLVVPVIKDVIDKDIEQISSEILNLAEKAKNKKLRTSDLEGGTFTISSLGKIGGVGFTPIINPPEVAILAISRTKKLLKLSGKEVVEVDVTPFSLSYDHRLINGADAGRFMQFLKEELESFDD